MRILPLVLFVCLVMLPTASAGFVNVNTRLCLDNDWPVIGQCTKDGGSVGSVTINSTGSLMSGTSNAAGYASLGITNDGTAYLNVSKTGYRSPGPTYRYVANGAYYVGQVDTLTLYVYLTPAVCSPTNQTVSVPFYVNWTYTVQNPGVITYFTVIERDPNVGSVAPVVGVYPFLGQSGTLHYPFGGASSRNTSTGSLFNNTGAYALVIMDESAHPLSYCTAQIVTTGTTFLPINLNDDLNNSIGLQLKSQFEDIANYPTTTTPEALDFGAFVMGLIVGRPWFFPNAYFWTAGLIFLSIVIGPRQNRDSGGEQS